ncbi:hypothetical protein LH612_29390, partial [Klebsiella pneumoniae]|nr:hypothetical protein [Klebsiella pneumoniae]
RPGGVLFNRVRPNRLPARSLTSAAAGRVDRARIRSGLREVGLHVDDDVLDGLVQETVEHAIRAQAEEEIRQELEALDMPAVMLPDLTGGVDVAELYELAEVLTENGIRSMR